jgi:hypothetical protein
MSLVTEQLIKVNGVIHDLSWSGGFRKATKFIEIEADVSELIR